MLPAVGMADGVPFQIVKPLSPSMFEFEMVTAPALIVPLVPLNPVPEMIETVVWQLKVPEPIVMLPEASKVILPGPDVCRLSGLPAALMLPPAIVLPVNVRVLLMSPG